MLLSVSLIGLKSTPFIILGVFFGILLILLAYTSSFNSSLLSETLAHLDPQVVKYRNIQIDLSDNVTTNAQLTIPAIGKGPLPGVVLIPGSGPADMNYTASNNSKLFLQISQYLSERGFVVLKYDKRGIDDNATVINKNLWGNTTYDDLKQDAQKVVNVLINQPEVDSQKIIMIGHSEGGELVARIATDNPTTKFDNIVLMAPRIEKPSDQIYYGLVTFPIEYAKQVLDKNQVGSFSLQEALQNQLFLNMIGGNTSLISDKNILEGTNLNKSADKINKDRYVNIDTELRPVLEKRMEKVFEGSKCDNPIDGPCPIYLKSLLNLTSTLGIIDNVSSSTGILILHGQNDSGSRVQQALLLQQKLMELKHPDHTLITYPGLGHHFYPSTRWTTESGPIPDYVLADLYSWLELHSK